MYSIDEPLGALITILTGYRSMYGDDDVPSYRCMLQVAAITFDY